MDAWIFETVRTPRGKAKAGGGLSSVTPIDLLGKLFRELERRGLDPAAVDDVVIGCATQTGEQGADLAKVAALCAGWPASVPGVTVNRFCASGLDAVMTAAARIQSGQDSLIVAGGIESVSRVPMFSDKAPLYTDPAIIERAGFVHMGVAADLVATLEGYDRADLDAYAVASHQKAANAWKSGHFARSLLPISGPDGAVLLAHDEHVRPSTTREQVSAMEPSFAEVGAQSLPIIRKHYPDVTALKNVHHRGNSPALADGAGVVVVATRERGLALGLKPRAKIRAVANASVNPVIMLTAGQEAIGKALSRAGLTVADVDLFEFAEAFAALCVKLQRDLGISSDRLNVNGGTIAMGHAFGATGAILVATALDELERRAGRFGVVGISGAAGVGAALVLERA